MHRFKRLKPTLQNSSGQSCFTRLHIQSEQARQVEQLPCRRSTACDDEVLCLLCCRDEVSVGAAVSAVFCGDDKIINSRLNRVRLGSAGGERFAYRLPLLVRNRFAVLFGAM
jgi:hypothetical protein